MAVTSLSQFHAGDWWIVKKVNEIELAVEGQAERDGTRKKPEPYRSPPPPACVEGAGMTPDEREHLIRLNHGAASVTHKGCAICFLLVRLDEVRREEVKLHMRITDSGAIEVKSA